MSLKDTVFFLFSINSFDLTLFMSLKSHVDNDSRDDASNLSFMINI